MLLINAPCFCLILFSILSSLITARPLHGRAPTVPGPPADPPQPANGDGIGPYNSKAAGWVDRLSKVKFFTIATAAGELGLTNAERNMRHYLDNSGLDLDVSPELMMQGLSGFRSAAQVLLQNEATTALESIKTRTGSKTFSSKWTVYYASKDQSWDWYFAIGGFSYSVTGVVTKTTSGGLLQYRVHVFDRYNWDSGKSVDIGPFHFEDTELGALHLKGLAREYILRGSGSVNEVKNFRSGTVVPLPSNGGRS